MFRNITSSTFCRARALRSLTTGGFGKSRMTYGFKQIGFMNSRRFSYTRPLSQTKIDAQNSTINFNIQKTTSICSIDESTITDSNIELNDLELYLAGEKVVLNLTWLRDSCHCNKCTHQYSRQRLFTIKDFQKEKFVINHIQLLPEGNEQLCPNISGTDDGGYLNVRWADGHESLYSVNWLKYIHKLYEKSNLETISHNSGFDFSFPRDDFYLPDKNINPQSKYWNVAELDESLIPVSYLDLIDGFKFNDDATFINANKICEMSQRRFEAMLTLSDQLVTYGLAKIIHVPEERNQVLNLVRSLAYERPTGYGTVFDVVVEPQEEINLAYSSLEFDLHSDLTYRETSPGVQLLHCIRNSTQGGSSYFSDSFKAAELLEQTNPILFNVLLKFPATFVVRDPYRNLKFRRQQPVITKDYQGNLQDVYYSPFMLPPVGFIDDVKLFYLALDKLTKLLQSKKNKIIAKMDPGDLFMFHNRRVLHGRSAYDATTSRRFLQGCYMDWDEIKCLYEKLHSYRYNKNLGG